jgi:TIR domain-containing protein
MSRNTRDLFLCHSSADTAIVREFAKLLDQREVTYWYREAEIEIGDSINEKISEGLRVSRYVLAFVSPSFLKGKLPGLVLQNALMRSKGRKVIPALMNVTPKVFFRRYPLLRDTSYGVLRERKLGSLADQVAAKVRREGSSAPVPHLHGREVELLLPPVADGIIAAFFRQFPEVTDAVFEPLRVLPVSLRLPIIESIIVKLSAGAEEHWILQVLPQLLSTLEAQSSAVAKLLAFLWRNPDIPNEWIAHLILQGAVSIGDLERIAALDSGAPNLSHLALCSDVIASLTNLRLTPKQYDLASRLAEQLRRSGLRCAIDAVPEAQIDHDYDFDNIDYPLEDPKPNTGPDILSRVGDLFECQLLFDKRDVLLATNKRFRLVSSLAVHFARAKQWPVALVTLRWVLDSRYWVHTSSPPDHDRFGHWAAEEWKQAKSKYVRRKLDEVRQLMVDDEALTLWRIELLLTYIDYEIEHLWVGPSTQLQSLLAKRLHATLEEFIESLRKRTEAARGLKNAFRIWRAIGALEVLRMSKPKLRLRHERWALSYMLAHIDGIVAITNFSVWDRFTEQTVLLIRSLRFDNELVASAALVASDAALRETEERGDLWITLQGSIIVRQLGTLISTIEDAQSQRDLSSFPAVRQKLRLLKKRYKLIKQEVALN